VTTHSEHDGNKQESVASLTIVPNFWNQLGLAVCVLFPSIWVVQKFLGNVAVIIYLVAGLWFFLVGYRFLLTPLFAILKERSFTLLAVVTLVVLLGLFALVYPLANSGIVGGGTDRDEALNIAVTELLNGRYPYYARTYIGVPITPMPGSMLLALPFVLLGNSAFQTLFWLALFVLAMKRSFQSGISALVLLWLLCGISPVVMNGYVNGDDLIANNLYVLLAIFFLFRSSDTSPISLAPVLRRPCQWNVIGSAILLGIALSSRSNHLLLTPLIFSYLIQHAGLRSAIISMMMTGLTFVAITLPFYLYDPAEFSPFSVANKLAFYNFVMPHAGVIIPVVSGLVAVVLAFQRMDRSLETFWRNAAIVQFIPSLVVAVLAAIPSATWQIGPSGWYGLNVLFVGAVAFWSKVARSIHPPHAEGSFPEPAKGKPSLNAGTNRYTMFR
jgi:hypothetical protein